MSRASVLQQILVLVKKRMEEGKLQIPYDWELINEINLERYELTKTGQKQFSHPAGTHDDRLWAFALAVHASRPGIPEYHPFAALGRNPNSLMPNINWRRLGPGGSPWNTTRPGDPPGVMVQNQLWCWACRKPVITRPQVCYKPPPS